MTTAPDSLPDDVEVLRAALAAEQAARREAAARAAGAEGSDHWSERSPTSSS